MKCFYHVACMNDWKRVFLEQIKLLEEEDIEPNAYVLGSKEDFKFVSDYCNAVYASDDLGLYESPTIDALYDFSVETQEKTFLLYMHTKGVSKPNYPDREVWRKLMEKLIIKDWYVNYFLAQKEGYEAIGFNLIEWADCWHFQGNFWITNTEFIRTFVDPREYRKKVPKDFPNTHRWPWNSNEFWIGSNGPTRLLGIPGYDIGSMTENGKAREFAAKIKL